MSRLDSFFNKGLNAVRCRTLLKLTVPRIKLLRNRKEAQLKQMRREIAKLLETGQEATARIKVEHIIREEKMMAAQEIIELFCELITARLPIVEAQRECPLDLKEAISSVCYAAPRCVDLPELLQVQMQFAGKYGKEFVLAATELRPECGVNRQLIELLSIRAPPPEVKLELLKEIAEEHGLDWDPSASETELLKPHEDLLNGPSHFVSGSKLPFPQRTHDESLNAAPEQVSNEQSDSDNPESIDFPEVPRQPLRSSRGTVSPPEMLPFPASALSDADEESPEPFEGNEVSSIKPLFNEVEKSVRKESESSDVLAGSAETAQFVPFISAPEMLPFPASALSDAKEEHPKPSADHEISSQKPFLNPSKVLLERSVSNECESSNVVAGPVENTEFMSPSQSYSQFPKGQSNPSPASRTISYTNVDLQDVLAAVQAAAEAAELSAAAARSAASLVQLRVSELVRGRTNDVVSDGSCDNPFRPA